MTPEVNFLDVNSAIFVHIGNFLSHWQFSFTLKIFFHIENFRSHCQISNFAAHFLLPASAGQLARFCKSEISIHVGNFHSHRKFSFTLAIFFHIGNFHSHRKLFGTKKLTSGKCWTRFSLNRRLHLKSVARTLLRRSSLHTVWYNAVSIHGSRRAGWGILGRRVNLFFDIPIDKSNS